MRIVSSAYKSVNNLSSIWACSISPEDAHDTPLKSDFFSGNRVVYKIEAGNFMIFKFILLGLIACIHII